MTETQLESLVYQLAFRFAFEIGDFATRNFFCKGNRVYNLDVEGVFVGKNLRWKKEERTILKNFVSLRKVKINSVLSDWLLPCFAGYPSLYDKWEIIGESLGIKVERVKGNIEWLMKNFESWLE